MNGLTYEQLKDLIVHDFFDLEQVKAIKNSLEAHKPITLPYLTDEQLKQLTKIAVIER